MIKATFFTHESLIFGFEISGHGRTGRTRGRDIVCAAVSSAAYMTANTVTEVLHLKAETEVNDGYMSVVLSMKDAERAKDIMAGFELHMAALADEHKNIVCKKENIENNTEVQ